ALHARQRAREQELIESEEVLPGVVDRLQEAKRMGLKLAVASSSPRSWVHGHLSRLGLLKEFDCIRCGDEVREAKPAPDLFLAALSCLGLKPEEAIVFEDAPHGVAAAKRAGIFCVAVPNALTRALGFDHADLTVESLAAITLAELLRRVGETKK
ncbi:HAD family hydrolase, partial [Candidatus Acetothermia bacterium]